MLFFREEKIESLVRKDVSPFIDLISLQPVHEHCLARIETPILQDK